MGRSTKGADYQEVPRPVAVLVDDYAAGFFDPPHCHARAQLIYACEGVMVVTTPEASYVVPPQRAVWVPGGVLHEVFARTRLSVRTLYVAPDAGAGLATTVQVLEVTELLRELIFEAARLPVEYDTEGREGLVMQLIVAELAHLRRTPLSVPMPRHPRLVRVCANILKDPSEDADLDDCAAAAGMGRRTFTRSFRRETGMSFATWRQNVRLMEAVSRLAHGASVTDVAFDVGYSSASAFTAMFRRTFGVPPTQYRRGESAAENYEEADVPRPRSRLAS